MVPRWRPAEQTLRLGEFNPLRANLAAKTRSPDVLKHLTDDWNAHRKFGYAADLVSSAFALGLPDLPDSVRAAAEFILSEVDANEGNPVRQIAARLLVKPFGNAESGGSLPTGIELIHARLRAGRLAAQRYPFNPLLWVDLARDYASLGQGASAERAMRIAVGLAPDNRFVVRSFTRLALHLGQRERADLPEEALRRLRRITRKTSDPWLAAAEIATSMVLGKSPSTIKGARSLLQSGDFSPFDLSELAGALGSLEIDAGATKAGKKFLSQALIRPTDNAVAQAAWTARHVDSSFLDPRSLEGPVTYEARAWEYYRGLRWHDAVNEAMNWHHDEPFASRPIHLATFVSGVVLADFVLCAELARAGLAVNSQDQTIRNNLAFALASYGNWKEAAEVLGELKPLKVREEIKTAYVATWGLISFRQGLLQEGRDLYRAAIERANKQGDVATEALATLYLAREERIAKTAEADPTLRCASELVAAKPLGHLQVVLNQVRSIHDGSGILPQQVPIKAKARRFWIRF